MVTSFVTTLRLQILLLVVSKFCGSDGSISLEYLQKANRLQSLNYTDHYFGCSLMGQVILWQVNGESLGGFLANSLTRSIVSTGSNFKYTNTALTIRSLNKTLGEAVFESILIISITDRQNIFLNVSCSNNINITSTTTNVTPLMRGITYSSEVGPESGLEHAFTKPQDSITNGGQLIFVFVCGTNSLNQQIGVDNRTIGFSTSDEVGETRGDSLINGTLTFEAVLSSRQPFRTTSFVFITRVADFRFTCANTFMKRDINVSAEGHSLYHNTCTSMITSQILITSPGIPSKRSIALLNIILICSLL